MKVLKIIVIMVLAIITINLYQPKSYAASVSTFDEMKQSINNFLNKGKSGQTGIDAKSCR